MTNVTYKFEAQLLEIVLYSMERMNLSREHSNVILLVLMLCLAILVFIRYIVKYRVKLKDASHKPNPTTTHKEDG